MQSKVSRWGNSLALRIPKRFAEEANLSCDSKVDISIEAGALVIRSVRKYTLEELLDGTTPESLHDEIDYGPAVGAEVW